MRSSAAVPVHALRPLLRLMLASGSASWSRRTTAPASARPCCVRSMFSVGSANRPAPHGGRRWPARRPMVLGLASSGSVTAAGQQVGRDDRESGHTDESKGIPARNDRGDRERGDPDDRQGEDRNVAQLHGCVLFVRVTGTQHDLAPARIHERAPPGLRSSPAPDRTSNVQADTSRSARTTTNSTAGRRRGGRGLRISRRYRHRARPLRSVRRTMWVVATSTCINRRPLTAQNPAPR